MAIVEGKTNFRQLEEYALQLNEIKNTSGRTERIKALVNQYILEMFSTVTV